MKRLERLFWCFIFALLLVPSARRAVAGEPAAFQLRPQVQVGAAGILLNQLVIPPPHVTLPPVRLAQAPLPGQTTLLSRQQIIALAKEAAPALDTTNWTGPDSVRAARLTRPLGEAEVAEMLRTVLQRDYVSAGGTLEIHLTRPWASVEVPVEPLSIQITDVPAAGVLPSMIAGFELWCGKERVGAWQAPLQARLWREIPVAHSPLTRGQLLREADIELERRDVLTQHEACIAFPVTGESLETACNVQCGTPIWSRLARPRPILHRGQLVEGLFQDGALAISLKVEALEDGALGQMVRVRNPKTRRELSGKVQNEDLVLIAL